MKKLMFTTMALFVMLALVGCPNEPDHSQSEKPTVTGVTVSPATLEVKQGATSSAFSAEVEGKNNPSQEVTWSITTEDGAAVANTVATWNAAAHTLTVAGGTAVGTKIRVVATSTADASKFGYAIVAVTAKESELPTSAITAVTINSQTTIELQPGDEFEFEAEVTGTGSFNDAVTWILGGTHKAGTTLIDNAGKGKLTIAADETTPGSVTVQAKSVQDPAKTSAVVTVSIVAHVAPAVEIVAVSPKTATVNAGGTQQFTAAVAVLYGAAQTVNWTVTGSTLTSGTAISNTGILTVGAAEMAATLTVTATSTFDNTKYDTATVTIPAPTFESVRIVTQPSPETTTIYQYLGTIPTNYTGLVVEAVYSRGPAKIIPLQAGDAVGYTLSTSAAVNTAATTPVTISYTEGGVTKTASFNFVVDALESIMVNATGYTTDYYQFYDTAVSGSLAVTASYATLADRTLTGTGAEAFTVNDTGVKFGADAPATPGATQNVVVTFNGKTANVPVTVHTLNAIDIDMATRSVNRPFAVTDANKLALIEGAVIDARYANYVPASGIGLVNITDKITASNISYLKISADEAVDDVYAVTITWNAKSDAFTLTVTDAAVLASITVVGTPKTKYYQFADTAFDPTGLTVTANFSKEAASKTGIAIGSSAPAAGTSGAWFDYPGEGAAIFNTPGTHTITISYRDAEVSPTATDRTATVQITVYAVSSLEIMLSKNEYAAAPTPVPTPAEVRGTITTANAVYEADSNHTISLLSRLTEIDIAVNATVENHGTIVVSWHGTNAVTIPFYYLEKLTLNITAPQFLDVTVNTINFGDLSITDGTQHSIQLSGTYTSVRWTLNGAPAGIANATTFTVPLGRNAKLGNNVLRVEVVLNGVTYSKNIVYRVVL